MRYLAALGLVFLGCATPGQMLNPSLFYKRDMVVSMDGITGDGVLVVPSLKRHAFTVTAKADMALYTFTSCHREVALENMPKEVKGFFTPAEGLEDTGSCPVEIGGYDKKGGRHSWAFIDFKTDESTLPATLRCNGELLKTEGVSVCQSRAGLLQRIEFDVEVDSGNSSCGKLGSASGKSFEFPLVKGQCVYAFRERSGERRFHRLVTLGYESILLRDQ